MKTMITSSRNGDIMGTWSVFFARDADFDSFVSRSIRVGYKLLRTGFRRSGMGTFELAGIEKQAFISEHGIETFIVHNVDTGCLVYCDIKKETPVPVCTTAKEGFPGNK